MPLPVSRAADQVARLRDFGSKKRFTNMGSFYLCPLPFALCPSEMPRYKLVVEYAGTKLQRLADSEERPDGSGRAGPRHTARRPAPVSSRRTGSGRTDAGVHALGQVMHVDLPMAVPPDALVMRVNDVERAAAVVGEQRDPGRRQARPRAHRAPAASRHRDAERPMNSNVTATPSGMRSIAS